MNNNMSDVIVMLPYPFCGNNELEVINEVIPHGSNQSRVHCNTCLAAGSMDDTEIGARIEWNRRAILNRSAATVLE